MSMIQSMHEPSTSQVLLIPEGFVIYEACFCKSAIEKERLE